MPTVKITIGIMGWVRDSQIKVSLGRSLASNARPRCIYDYSSPIAPNAHSKEKSHPYWGDFFFSGIYYTI